VTLEQFDMKSERQLLRMASRCACEASPKIVLVRQDKAARPPSPMLRCESCCARRRQSVVPIARAGGPFGVQRLPSVFHTPFTVATTRSPTKPSPYSRASRPCQMRRMTASSAAAEYA